MALGLMGLFIREKRIEDFLFRVLDGVKRGGRGGRVRFVLLEANKLFLFPPRWR